MNLFDSSSLTATLVEVARGFYGVQCELCRCAILLPGYCSTRTGDTEFTEAASDMT